MPVCTARILSFALAVLLSCTPQLMSAVTEQAENPQTSATPTGSARNRTSQASSPVPDAPQPAQTSPAQTNGTAQNSATAMQPAQQPQGTATARSAKTIGGPASKPAGSAIAPAKQRHMRSLLIKVGAVVAAGATLGTVYALTRATPNRPPGAH